MRICLVALGVYPFLNANSGICFAGGAEFQQVQIGRGLQARGLEVSYIVLDHGQPDGATFQGCTAYKAYQAQEGIVGLRFFYPRMWKIWQALVRARADIYYCRAAGFLPALLAFFCRRYRSKFVFAGASDTDFMPQALMIPTRRDKILYKYGIRKAAAIIVQSEKQKKLLWDNFGLRGTVIRNLFLSDHHIKNSSTRDLILWVSNLRPLKQPQRFVRLAAQFPQERFVMIGGPDPSKPGLYEQTKEQCQAQPNMTFLGFQPFAQADQYFEQAKVFVNTSLHEGFPNTFLQAWARGVPVISFVDPDNLIRRHKLGLVVGSEPELAQALQALLDGQGPDPQHIRTYFQSHHGVGVIDQYCTLLESL